MARKKKEDIVKEEMIKANIEKKTKVVKNLETRIILLVVVLCVGIGGTLVVGHTLKSTDKCVDKVEIIEDKEIDKNKKDEEYGKGKLLGGGYHRSLNLAESGECEKFKDDGTTDGKEICTYELGNLIDRDNNQYSIKKMRYYDGENRNAGYTYEFYINGNLTDIKSEVSVAEFVGDYVFVRAWSYNTTNDGQFLIDAKTGKTVLALDPSSIQFNDYQIAKIFEKIDEYSGKDKIKYIYYDACSKATLTKHRIDLDTLIDTIIHTENNVVCDEFY